MSHKQGPAILSCIEHYLWVSPLSAQMDPALLQIELS